MVGIGCAVEYVSIWINVGDSQFVLLVSFLDCLRDIVQVAIDVTKKTNLVPNGRVIAVLA